MDLSLGETQVQLADAVGTFLSRLPKTPMSQTPPEAPQRAWLELANELGLLGLMLPDDEGGYGGMGDDLLVVMEAMGRHLFDQPFAEVAITGLSLLSAAKQADLVQAVIAGQEMVAPIMALNGAVISRIGDHWTLSGVSELVLPASEATRFIVAGRFEGDDVVLLVDGAAATVRPVATTDERWAGQVEFNTAPAVLLLRGGEATAALSKAEDIAIAALCAESSGVVSRLLDDTVEFTKQRRQFGQPISRFQVLQHRMSDMLIQYEMARSAAILACLSLGKPEAERRKATSAAKIVVSEACRFIGQNAVQLHGGLGMSAETEMTRWFKRATVIEYQLGSRDDHVERYRQVA
ncbi:MAG: acyl-CoA dehydrogenase family protein [Janthinobacterium lividum]